MESPISTRAALLQALSIKPGYGLEIITRIKKDAGLVLGQGSVYPTLSALEDDGLVRRAPVPKAKLQVASSPKARSTRASIYELTRSGKRLVEVHRRTIMRVFSLAS
jgi:DNA-binding PadR family transcriptional regulator